MIDSITEKVRIIDECHEQQTVLRKIKHTKEKKPSTCAISKEDSLEFDRIVSEEVLSRRKMDESQWVRLVENNPFIKLSKWM